MSLHSLRSSHSPRPLRVYVAAGSHDLERARRVMRLVREAGGSITFDWTAGREGELAKYPTDADVPAPLRRMLATRCLVGVRSAELLWLLSSKRKSEGRTWEHCAAHHVALEREDYRVIVSGPVSTAFLDLGDPAHLFATDDLALAYVREVIGVRRRAA